MFGLFESENDNEYTMSDGGGRNPKDCKKTGIKKIIVGKERCIYKISNDKKEYIKYKGTLVGVKKFITMNKALEKAKATKKLVKKIL